MLSRFQSRLGRHLQFPEIRPVVFFPHLQFVDDCVVQSGSEFFRDFGLLLHVFGVTISACSMIFRDSITMLKPRFQSGKRVVDFVFHGRFSCRPKPIYRF